ncbi:exonuclease domain-containing protein [Vibrio parahaemolyticus]
MFGYSFQSIEHLELVRRELEKSSLPDVFNSIGNTPLPGALSDARELDTLVLDFETTGFNPEVDRVISIGWVEIRNSNIRLNSARHVFINHAIDICHESVKVHHIRPETLHVSGISEQAAFTQLLDVIAGKILVAHGCIMEQRFLEQYIKMKYQNLKLPLIWLDTLKIEQYRTQLRPTRSDWRLSSIRKELNLPTYQAHNALNDAIATAELYLAQINCLFGLSSAPLHVLVNASR